MDNMLLINIFSFILLYDSMVCITPQALGRWRRNTKVPNTSNTWYDWNNKHLWTSNDIIRRTESSSCPPNKSLISKSDLNQTVTDFAIELKIYKSINDSYFPSAISLRDTFDQKLQDFLNRLQERPEHLKHILVDIAKKREAMEPKINEILAVIDNYNQLEKKFNEKLEKANKLKYKLNVQKHICFYNCGEGHVEDVYEAVYETSEETWDYSSDEISYEISEEMSDEISYEKSEETSDEISYELSNEISDEISNEMSDEISNEISGDISDKKSDEIMNNLWDEEYGENAYCTSVADLYKYIPKKLNEFKERIVQELITKIEDNEQTLNYKIDKFKYKLKDMALEEFGRTMYDILSLQDEFQHFYSDISDIDLDENIVIIMQILGQIDVALLKLAHYIEQYGKQCRNCKIMNIHLQKRSKSIDYSEKQPANILDKLISENFNNIKESIYSDYDEIFEQLHEKMDNVNLTSHIENLKPLHDEIINLTKEAESSLEDLKKNDIISDIKKITNLSKICDQLLQEINAMLHNSPPKPKNPVLN